jgi:hypothetical protein
MKDRGQFGERPAGKPAHGPSGRLDCAGVESLWVEAVEGTLPSAVAEQVRTHTAECASCREKISRARSGREWMLVLKQEPLIPPSDLVAKILARTAGSSEESTLSSRWTTLKIPAEADAHSAERYRLPGYLSGYSSTDDRIALVPAERTGDDLLRSEDIPSASSTPVWQRPSVVLLRKTVFEPRMALVAAMAFFSISLTLNLMGVKLTRLRAADLEPQSMRRAVTRQYAQANARVVHYYENLRIVYEVESRVHQLRQAADSASVPDKTGYSHGKGAGHDGQVNREDRNNQSSRDGLHRERMEVTPVTDQDAQRNRLAPAGPKPMISGPVVDAYFNAKPLMPSLNVFENAQPKFLATVFFAFLSRPASQAPPSLSQFVRFSVQERKSA